MPRGDLSLTIGYWLVSHKSTLQRWWAILLMAVILFGTLWVVISMSVFVSQDSRVLERTRQAAAALTAYRPVNLGIPKDIDIGDTTVVQRDASRADIVGFIANPNTLWGASQVTYHFSIGPTPTPSATVALNPGEERAVVILNQTVESDVAASLVIDSVTWVRASTGDRGGTFTVSELIWAPTRVAVSGTTVETITMSAILKNTSVYNYYRVDVPIVVRSESGIIAVDELRIDRWNSREEKTVRVSWPYRVSGVKSIEIVPTVSRFDPGNRF